MKNLVISMLGVAGLAAVATAGVPVLLTVDATDTSAVVISATGAASAVDTSADSLGEGVTLVDVLTAEFSGSVTGLTGTLSPNGTDATYVNWTNNFSTLSDFDINLWGSFGEPQDFSTMAPAFTGSITIDFSGASFPAAGTTGTLIAGDTPGPTGGKPIIGAWQIVPAPGAVALAPLALVATRRRRK